MWLIRLFHILIFTYYALIILKLRNKNLRIFLAGGAYAPYTPCLTRPLLLSAVCYLLEPPPPPPGCPMAPGNPRGPGIPTYQSTVDISP